MLNEDAMNACIFGVEVLVVGNHTRWCYDDDNGTPLVWCPAEKKEIFSFIQEIKEKMGKLLWKEPCG